MNIVFFTHPNFLGLQSMPRFAKMLGDGMANRGHQIRFWAPKPYFYHLPFLKKWMGYIDQYILFPIEIKRKLKIYNKNFLFVFCDNGLGAWVPLVNEFPHVIHCHDFLAQRSALGEIEENITSWTGRLYQKIIHHGYSKGKNFISVSKQTKSDLHRFLSSQPLISEVVYNGLNRNFFPMDPAKARHLLSMKTEIDLSAGYLLHVGGNEWYKNRLGLLDIYNSWRSGSEDKLPLLLVGHPPSEIILKASRKSPFKSEIHFISGLEDEFVRLAYAGSTVFLFPSIAEGFGWPIVEAMASGCLVMTTNEAPMTEVAGDAGTFIPRRPIHQKELKSWASDSAKVLDNILLLSAEQRELLVQTGLRNAKRFDPELALDRIEEIYQQILQS